MKFLPDSIARKVAGQGLFAKQHSPEILFGAGVVSMVGSTIFACRATLKVEDLIDTIERDQDVAKSTHARLAAAEEAGEPVTVNNGSEKLTYTDAELKRDLHLIKVKGLGKLVRLYAPSVLLGGIGIACLTKSHSILMERQLALTAAYAAVDSAFNRYRERVVERYGEDTDRELLYDSEQVDIIDDETGEIVNTTRITDAPGSKYSRVFGEWSSRNWSPDPGHNLVFLRCQQNWANDRLRARGHLFLNEVYSELGLSHSKAGAIVGWRWHPGDGQLPGDNTVDFGIFDGINQEADDFFRGRGDEVMLDFNVDGVIYDKLDESDRP